MRVVSFNEGIVLKASVLKITLSRSLLSLAIGASGLSLTAPVIANESQVDLSKVVVSAAGFEQKLVEAPASISVITQEELRSRPFMTLLDAVRELEGVDVGETRDKTGQGSISIRGMGSDYTLILINGRRQNNHGDIYPNNFGGNQFNHIPPLDAIERIEVIRGPASTLYGADAMGGVINIITRRDMETWSGSVTASGTHQTDSAYGDDRTVDVYLSGPILPGTLGMSIRGSRYQRLESSPVYDPIRYPNGEVRDRSLGFGSGGKTVDNTNSAAGFTVSWTPSEQQTITFDYDVSKQVYDNKTRKDDSGNEIYPVGTVDSFASIWRTSNVCLGGVGRNQAACEGDGGTWSKRADPRVGYDKDQEFTRDYWALSHDGQWGFGNSLLSLSHVATNNDGRTLPFTVSERQHLLAMIEGTGAYVGLTEEERKAIAENTFLPRQKRTLESRQYVLDAKLDMPFQWLGQHTAVVGAQITQGELEDGVFGMESGRPNRVQKHNMWSVFAEDTWYVTAPLAVTAGLRYDNHDVFGDNVSPRLYAIYNASNSLTVKGGISTGFKTPKTTALYDGVTGFVAQGTSPTFGNPDLKPETTSSSELAVYWQHPTANHHANITVFKNAFKDKISSQPCGPTTPYTCASTGEYADLGYATGSRSVNIDEVVIEGVEVAGRLQLVEQLGLRANYTYTDGEQRSGVNKGRPYGSAAKHMANATLDWRVLANLNVFLTMEARSKRYRSWDTEADKALHFKDYEVLHLGASYQISQNVTLNGRINNVLDRDFTTYQSTFEECSSTAAACVIADGDTDGYQATFRDDYNNKDKRRNLWMSLNVNF